MTKIKPVIAIIFAACFIVSSCNENKTAGESTAAKAELPKQIIEPANPYAEVDKSPLDISYYPVNYPKQLMDKNDSAALAVRVIYSRPHKMGRAIFTKEGPPKSILQYGKYWRLGANEATEIEFFKPVTINNRPIVKGRYIIYCIPNPGKWTIVLNSNLFSFGLHQDSTKNLMQFDIPVQQTNDDIEYFTMVFEKSLTGADLIMAWGNLKARLPISF